MVIREWNSINVGGNPMEIGKPKFDILGVF
jgi:hypothetical protein